MNYLKRLWLTSLSNGKRILLTSRNWLRGLLMGCVMLVSACGSNSLMPLCTQSQVQVDPSLMGTPNYTQTLLDSLSSNPNDATPK